VKALPIATHPRLQPYVLQTATLLITGCNPTYPRLQPYLSQAATLLIPGCKPTYPRLQPYLSQVKALPIATRAEMRPLSRDDAQESESS